MKKLKVEYLLRYKITDYDLYEELESDESAWVNFLTTVMDSIRFSEDFTKRWISTEGDELFWDDENNFGEAQLVVTVEDNYNGDVDSWNRLLPDFNETWDMSINSTADKFNLDDYVSLISENGAIWNIVNWGSTIRIDEHSDGCLFQYDDDLRGDYIGRIHNVENGLIISGAKFIDSDGNTYELCDHVKTKEEVLESMEKI